jgi:uncharacterized cupin superfamily protein
MSTKSPAEHLLTASDIAAGRELAVSHPLNPESEVYIRPLGARVGLERVQISLGRIPPGKESFAFHAHQGDEEFLFIVSGRGRADIGDQTFEVGPGDFMAFPTPSVGHHLRNPYQEDLVYLMGGERGRTDIVEFAKLGKVGIFSGAGVQFIDSHQLEARPFSDYVKKP